MNLIWLKFISERIFVSKNLSIVLLLCHIFALIMFARKWVTSVKEECKKATNLINDKTSSLNPNYVVSALFVSNFIGISFARTLHYQFYCWNFHSLPFLLLSTNIPLVGNVFILAAIEYAFNIFPATATSSSLLQVAHMILLLSLFYAKVPRAMFKQKAI